MTDFKEQYWNDYKNIITSVFSQKSITEQPDYLLFFGLENTDLIKSTYTTIRDDTERGKVINKYPISFLIVTTNGEYNTLGGVPHDFIQADFTQPQQVQSALIKLGILNFEKVLSIYLGILPNLTKSQLVENFKAWNGVLQKIIIYTHHLPPQTTTPDDFVLALAESGFFPKAQHQYRYPIQGEKTESTLNFFEAKSYILRHPKIEDIHDLLEIERQVWAPHIQQSQEEIERLIRLYAQESLVFEEEGKVVAVNFAQALPSIDSLAKGTWKALAEAPQTSGPVIRLITLNVENTRWVKEYGYRLIEFLLYWRSLQANVTSVIAATRCNQYANHANVPYEKYVLLKNNQGLPFDPTPRFHVQHGAKLLGLIPNYRPKDTENKAYGILIEYDVKKRVSQKPLLGATSISIFKSREEIQQVVEEYILMLLGDEQMKRYTSSAPLMSMGLNSLDFMELRSLLTARLGFEIPETFFFKYGTVDKVIDYFAETFLETHKDQLLVREELSTTNVNEPIAIIGMGCRFPKGVTDPEQFYQFLKMAIDGITEFPKERLNSEDTPIPYGSFLNNVDLFDSNFFGISPREAKYMDPQARLLLEVSWEALENAGIAPASLKDSDIGVFVGITTDDYTHLLRIAVDEDSHNAYIGTGNFASAVVGRISHFLGLQGPNMAIDTACSSSLVAIHQACLSLHVKESQLAIAGGVQLNLLPDWYIDFDKASMLSPDGHCKTFDASANGYVRGEGCGIVILKRLSDAIRDSDNIVAVIKTTHVNQDGTSSGFTVPNEQAQEALIKKAMKKANVAPVDVDYIEAHGTGTPLGDPIEVEAIGETYGQNRTEPLLLGTVKSNIGHLEAAAGIAGLMKVVLSLQKETIPKNLNFKQLNPKIHLNFPAQIVSEETPWPKTSKKRMGAVSSFGFSGTNAHAIIEEAPLIESKEIEDKPLHVVALSAKSEQALADLVEHYLVFVKEHPEIQLGNLAYTANTGRNHFKYRLAVLAKDLLQFQDKLQSRDYISGTASDYVRIKVGFVHEKTGNYHIDKTDPSNHKIHLTRDIAWEEFLPILSEYYIHGAEIDWKAFDDPYNPKKIPLPTYPFQRERYWVEVVKTQKKRTAHADPLLGEFIHSPSDEKLFKNEIDLVYLPFLKDHKVFDRILFPGAGFVTLIQTAGDILFKGQSFTIDHSSFIEQPLAFDMKKPTTIELLAKPKEGGYTATVYSIEKQAWILPCKKRYCKLRTSSKQNGLGSST